jgi:phosphoglycolate phosphatase
MKYRCLLFDLDGTLIDSKTDIATSVNLMLAELARAPLPFDEALGFVGEGVRLLVSRALRASLEREPEVREFERALEIYFRHYGTHLLDQTTVYPEVRETLAALAHLPKAVVTNKPYVFTATILEQLDLISHFAVVLGGDSLPERKPSPLPLIEAARRCEVTASECLMIGDSGVDVQAGRAAEMTTCGYIAGFRGRDELIEAGADLLIERFSELLKLTAGESS